MKWQKSIPVVMLLLGIAAGFLIRDAMIAKGEKGAYVVRRENVDYKYINPLIECDIADDVFRNRELHTFKEKIAAFVKSSTDKRLASTVSVYFRELNDGLWFSVGDTERFVPASLRKVPLMIALLKQAEKGDKGLLERKVRFDLAIDYNVGQIIKPSHTLVAGQEYSVRDLISRMIVYSDNNAFMLLTKVVDNNEFDNVYATLRIQNPRAIKDDEFLSVQTYASFFRVLYNATYLSKKESEWALGILAQAEFRAGLVNGVPSTVPIAHKFGEKADQNSGTVQLHDCGIVYYPRHPYLLCVMSRGTKFETLDDVIYGVSKIVYGEIDVQHRKN